MKTILAALCALCIGSAATAQEFHGGLGLDYGKPHSGEDQAGFSWLGGVTFGGPTLRYGVELDIGMPLNGNTDYDTNRLRLIGMYDIGDYTILGAVGVTRYQFGDEDNDGSNFGIGVERDFSDRWSLRGEFIRDFLDEGFGGFTDAVTTTRIAMIYRFF